MSYVFNYVANPVRNYVASLLVSALSKYIVGIEVNSLGVLSQEMNLQNVELNLSSLGEDLGIKLPFVIKSSYAKSLKIIIPWTSLLSLPIGIYVDSLNIELVSTDDNGNESKENTESVVEIADSSESDSKTSSGGMWGDSYLKKIIANASIRIDNVIIGYTHNDVRCVLTSRYMEVMSSGPEDNWEYNWQEPRGTKGSIYKSINMGDFGISLDYLRNGNGTGDEYGSGKEAERIFYHPIISNVNVHIRCMFSLWDGIIHMMMNGYAPENSVPSSSKQWNMFGLFSEERINEINEYCMHIKEIEKENNECSYEFHNLQTIYDIAYYTNMIDIHIDDDVVIAINTYQMNTIIQLFNQILESEDSPKESDAEYEKERLPEDNKSIPQESDRKNDDREKAVTQESNQVNTKFNINSIGISIGTVLVTYYMPVHLIPSSYARNPVVAEEAFPPSIGADKDSQSMNQLTYLVPKSYLKPVLTSQIHGIQFVMNLYDNAYYCRDVLFCFHDLSITMNEKVLLDWNSIPTTTEPLQSHHICMFKENKPIQTSSSLSSSSNAFFFRFKQYSSIYHDYLLDHHEDVEDILPAAYMELSVNHLHIIKEKLLFGYLNSMLQYMVPIHTMRSPVESNAIEIPSHKDYYYQCSVTDFSLTFNTHSSQSVSPIMSAQLHSFSFAYYNNLSCPCCPHDTNFAIVLCHLKDFSISHNLHIIVSLQNLDVQIVNHTQKLIVLTLCDYMKVDLDTDPMNSLVLLVSELAAFLRYPELPQLTKKHSLSCVLDDLSVRLKVEKQSNVITAQSILTSRVLLHSLSLMIDTKPLICYPSPTSMMDSLSHAFEMIIEYSGNSKKGVFVQGNRWTLSSASLLIDFYLIACLIEDVVEYERQCSKEYKQAVVEEITEIEDGSFSIPSFIEFDMDVKAFMNNFKILNLYISSCEYMIYPSFFVHSPSITLVNTNCSAYELNMIIKGFRLEMSKRSLVEIKDMYIIVNIADYSLTASSEQVVSSISLKDILYLFEIKKYYSEWIRVLYDDFEVVQQSLEMTEVVTDSGIILRNSIDRAAIANWSGEGRVRRFSINNQSVHSRDEHMAQKSAKQTSIWEYLHMSYSIKKMIVLVEMNNEYRININDTYMSLVKDEMQLSIQNLSVLRLAGDNANDMLLYGDKEMFSILLKKDDIHHIQCSIQNVSIHLNGPVCCQVVDDILHGLNQLDPMLPSRDSKESKSKEEERLSLKLELKENYCYVYYSDSKAYQVKCVYMLLAYDIYPNISKYITLVMQDCFVSDDDHRLLLDDFSCHCDLDLAHYRSGSLCTLSLQLPFTSLTLFSQDMMNMVFMIEAFLPLLSASDHMKTSKSDTSLEQANTLNSSIPKSMDKSIPSTTSLPKSPHLSPIPSSLNLSNQGSSEETSMEYCVTIQISEARLSLSNRTDELEWAMRNLHFHYSDREEAKTTRMVSLTSFSFMMNNEVYFRINPLSLPPSSPSCCVFVDRQIQEVDREWYYCSVGDVHLNVNPTLIQLLYDCCIVNFYTPVSLLRIPTYSSSITQSLTKPEKKLGITMRTNSIQCYLSSVSSSILLACHSLHLQHSATVDHVELHRCCIATYKEKNLLFSCYSNHPEDIDLVLNECKLTVNVDKSTSIIDSDQQYSTSRASIEMNDVSIVIDDSLLMKLALLYDAYAPLIQLAHSASTPSTSTLHPGDTSPCVISAIDSDTGCIEEDTFPTTAFQFPQESSIPPSALPSLFSLYSLSVVYEDKWPEDGELVVVPTVVPEKLNESDAERIITFPSLDYYSIKKGQIPRPITSEYLHDMEFKRQEKASSRFSSLWSEKAPSLQQPHQVSMQFRFPSIVRIFSVMVKTLSESDIDALAGEHFTSFLGDSLEFDVLAWSEVSRSFNCIKSICVPVERSEESMRNTIRQRSTSTVSDRSRSVYSVSGLDKESGEGDATSISSSVYVNNNMVEFYEMAPPYSYSSRYQIRVHLRYYKHGEMTVVGGMVGIVKGITEIIRNRVSFSYFIS